MLKEILGAISFLTIIPYPSSIEIEKNHIRNSMRWFPFVGLWLGYLLYLLASLFSSAHLPSSVEAFLLLLALTIATGALHADGFADTTDGFFGGKTKEDCLRIMKESTIGAFGAVGLIFLFLGKFIFLSLLSEHHAFSLLLFVIAWSRWGMVFLSLLGSYAKETGIGTLYSVTVTEVSLSGVLLFTLNWYVTGLSPALGFLLLTLFSFFLLARYSEKRIGGLVGDVYGFGNEICELLLFFFVTLLLS